MCLMVSNWDETSAHCCYWCVCMLVVFGPGRTSYLTQKGDCLTGYSGGVDLWEKLPLPGR
jgi:hypothetical protein